MKRLQIVINCALIHLCFSVVAYSYDKLNIGVGYGFRDFNNINVQYLMTENTGFSLGIGYLPGHISHNDYHFYNTTKGRVVCADYYLNFGNSSKLSGIPVWYIRTGIAYLLFQDFQSSYLNEKRMTEEHIINLQIGREINFTQKFGMRIHLGASISIYKNLIYGEYPQGGTFSPYLDLRLSNIPINLGFNVFYRF